MKTKRASDYAVKVAAILCVLAGMFGYWATIAFRRLLRGEFSDFRVFYFAANAMLRHGDPYARQHRSYIYPPLLALLYTPLALLPQKQAGMLLLCINLALILAALLIITRECLRRFEGSADPLAVIAVCVLALVPIFDKVRGELQMFQTNALVLLMFALALRWLDRHPIWSGIALGFAFNVKYLPLVMVPYLLLRRRWTTALSMVAACVGFALLPAVYSGWHENLRHLSIAFNGLLRMADIDIATTEAAVVGNVQAGFSLSLTSAVARIAHSGGADHWSVPILISLLGACMAVAALCYRFHRLPSLRWSAADTQRSQPFQGLVALEWAGMMLAALVFSPQTNSRHLILLMPATVILSTFILIPRAGVPRLPLLLAFLILLLGLTFPWGGTLSPFAQQFQNWHRCSGQSWCMLGAYCALLWAGLGYVQALLHGSPRIDPFRISQRPLSEEQLRPGRAWAGQPAQSIAS